MAALFREEDVDRYNPEDHRVLLAQKPMGFVAMLGVLALVGMIARNSVILIDQIGTEIAAGHHPWDAVVIAAIHRTRPILLTAAAAAQGAPFWFDILRKLVGIKQQPAPSSK